MTLEASWSCRGLYFRQNMMTAASSDGGVGGEVRLRSFGLTTPGETMQLSWVSGLVGERGQVRYRAGSAEFRQGALVRSLSEEANEETFWYR